MRTTVTIDDDLLAAASAALGTGERSTVLRESLKALIEREAARRLARLGGTDPAAAAPSRRDPREGWAEDARRVATERDDALVWPEFADESDAEPTP